MGSFGPRTTVLDGTLLDTTSKMIIYKLRIQNIITLQQMTPGVNSKIVSQTIIIILHVHNTHTFKIQNTVKKAAKELKMQKSKTIKASQCVRSSENCSLERMPNGQFNFRS